MERRKTQKMRLSGLITQAFKRTRETLGSTSVSRTSKLCNSEFIKDVVFGPRMSKVVPSQSLDRLQHLVKEHNNAQFPCSYRTHLDDSNSLRCDLKQLGSGTRFDEGIRSCVTTEDAKLGEPVLESTCEGTRDPFGLEPVVGNQSLFSRQAPLPCSSAWSPCSSTETTHSYFSPLFCDHSTDSISLYSILQSPDLTFDSDIASLETFEKTDSPALSARNTTSMGQRSFFGTIVTPISTQVLGHRRFEVSEDDLLAPDPLEACLSKLQKAYQGKDAVISSSVKMCSPREVTGCTLLFPDLALCNESLSSLASEQALEDVLELAHDHMDSSFGGLWPDLHASSGSLSFLGTCDGIHGPSVIDSPPCPSLPLPPLPSTPLPEDPDIDNLDVPAFGSLTSRLLHGNRNTQGQILASPAFPVLDVPGQSLSTNSDDEENDDYDQDMAQILYHSGNYCLARRHRTTSLRGPGTLDVDTLASIAASPLSLISQGDSLPSNTDACLSSTSNSSRSMSHRNSLSLLPQHILHRRLKEGIRPHPISGPAF